MKTRLVASIVAIVFVMFVAPTSAQRISKPESPKGPTRKELAKQQLEPGAKAPNGKERLSSIIRKGKIADLKLKGKSLQAEYDHDVFGCTPTIVLVAGAEQLAKQGKFSNEYETLFVERFQVDDCAGALLYDYWGYDYPSQFVGVTVSGNVQLTDSNGAPISYVNVVNVAVKNNDLYSRVTGTQERFWDGTKSKYNETFDTADVIGGQVLEGAVDWAQNADYSSGVIGTYALVIKFPKQ